MVITQSAQRTQRNSRFKLRVAFLRVLRASATFALIPETVPWRLGDKVIFALSGGIYPFEIQQ